MIRTCEAILPNEKTKLVKTITSYKHPNDTDYMTPDEKEKKREEDEKEKNKSQEDLKRELKLVEGGYKLNQESFANWMKVVKEEQPRIDKKVKDKIDDYMAELKELMKGIERICKTEESPAKAGSRPAKQPRMEMK